MTTFTTLAGASRASAPGGDPTSLVMSRLSEHRGCRHAATHVGRSARCVATGLLPGPRRHRGADAHGPSARVACATMRPTGDVRRSLRGWWPAAVLGAVLLGLAAMHGLARTAPSATTPATNPRYGRLQCTPTWRRGRTEPTRQGRSPRSPRPSQDSMQADRPRGRWDSPRPSAPARSRRASQCSWSWGRCCLPGAAARRDPPCSYPGRCPARWWRRTFFATRTRPPSLSWQS